MVSDNSERPKSSNKHLVDGAVIAEAVQIREALRESAEDILAGRTMPLELVIAQAHERRRRRRTNQ